MPTEISLSEMTRRLGRFTPDDARRQVLHGAIFSDYSGSYVLSAEGRRQAAAAHAAGTRTTELAVENESFASRVANVLEQHQRYPGTTVQSKPPAPRSAAEQEMFNEQVVAELERRCGRTRQSSGEGPRVEEYKPGWFMIS